MEKAFRCPQCGAQVLFEKEAEDLCFFCSAPLKESDALESVDWGFFTPKYLAKDKYRTLVCRDCGKKHYMASDSEVPMCTCSFCGGSYIEEEESSLHPMPAPTRIASFRYTLEEARAAYKKRLKQENFRMRFYGGKDYIESISPIYVPCFLFDYQLIASTVLSVVPLVKIASNMGDKLVDKLTTSEITFERSSSAVTPYPKTFTAEMVWTNVPESACTGVRDDVFEKISPFMIKGNLIDEEKLPKDCVFTQLDKDYESISNHLLAQIRTWVKECIITENLEHFKISSYVDETQYSRPLGELVYLPMWQMKRRKKAECVIWYMNGISGVDSDVRVIPLSADGKEENAGQGDSLGNHTKKKIKNYSYSDVTNPELLLNGRTYMVDTVASAFAMESQLNQSASDKALLRLEKQRAKTTIDIKVPITDAYGGEVSEELKASRNKPLPSEPVPLPDEHSPLFMMKQEIQNRSLGRGKRLPERPIDRRVGNEKKPDEIQPDTHESLAVEFGLADLPEYDPDGPSPFKKS